MATATTDKLLTAEDVAELWGVGVEYVWDAVDDEECPLRFVYLGRGTPRRGRGRGKGGQRGLYRFRPDTVAEWTRAKERGFRSKVEERDEASVAALAAIGDHDGKVRGGRKGKAGPRGR